MEELKNKIDKNTIIKEAIPYIIIIVVVVLIRTFIVTPVIVDGDSMNPTLDNGNFLLLAKYDKNYSFGDIVVLDNDDDKLIKRVIGKPGDYVSFKDGKLYINDKEVKDKFSDVTDDFELSYITDEEKIPEGYYLVLGDNRQNSLDSRIIGLVKKDRIKGKILCRIFPFKTIDKYIK